ncbi:MAG: cytochrome c-type biogenesis protein CcmH [Maricaulaceae bacterium]|nr:cytochrome c-type biogenesis protein CcmH [Maricaulaceae bacterium]
MIATLLSALVLVQAQALPPEDEARALELMREIRCVVCAGQSIADSEVALAQDMRAFVRARVADGASAAEVREALSVRYGDEVLLRPPFTARTLPLWLAPLVILALGGLLLAGAARRPSRRRRT